MGGGARLSRRVGRAARSAARGLRVPAGGGPPGLGLVHDHAYWVSHLRATRWRARRGQRPQPCVRTRSRRRHEGRQSEAHDPPEPESVSGTEWQRIPARPKRNALDLRLENVRRAHIDGSRARLTGRRCLLVSVRTDGRALVRLTLPFPAAAVARRGRACGAGPAAREVLLTRGGATILAPAGAHSWVILPD